MSELMVVLDAKNKASEVLRNVGQDIKVLAGGVEDFGSKVNDAAVKVELSFSSIAKAISASALAMAAFKAGSSVFAAIGESFNQFDAAGKSIKGLESSLTLSGKTAEGVSAKMRDLANAIETATNIDANKITDIQSSAFMKGIDASQIGEASKAAVGLAEAFKTDLSGGLDRAAQAAQGNFDSFEALIPGIKQMATAEEKLAAVSKLATDGLSLKSKAAQDSSSVFNRMTVQINNLYESVGALLEPFRTLIYDGVAVLAGMVSNSLGPIIKDMSGIFNGMSETVTNIAKNIAQNFMAAFTAAEVAVGNFSKSMNVARDSINLALEVMRSSIEHALTKALPAYTVWFASNFSRIMIDSFKSVAVASSNLTSQMAGYWKVWLQTLDGTINSPIGLYGKLHEVAMGHQLLKGFKPITDALPKIASRVVTETEEELRKALTIKINELTEIYDKKMLERLQEIDKFINGKPIDLNVNLIPSMNTDELNRVTNMALPINQAVESRILVRGPGDSPQAQTAANTRALLDETKKMNAKLDNFKAREFPVGYDSRFSLENQIIRSFRPDMVDREEPIKWTIFQ